MSFDKHQEVQLLDDLPESLILTSASDAKNYPNNDVAFAETCKYGTGSV